ncbi:MAG: hypothetical protein U1E28_06365 [Beijerinckiaceae bacterium]
MAKPKRRAAVKLPVKQTKPTLSPVMRRVLDGTRFSIISEQEICELLKIGSDDWENMTFLTELVFPFYNKGNAYYPLVDALIVIGQFLEGMREAKRSAS